MRPWLPLLIVPLLALLAGCGPEGPPRAPPSASAAAPLALPAIALKTLDRKPAQLDTLAAGKVALVSFWATWCEACVAELDALNRLDEKARQSGALVIGVAVGETPEKAAEFTRAHKLVYPQLVDEELQLATALGQRKVPTTLVLDRQGRVVWSGGALSEEALAAFRAAIASR
ncbi:MAG: TlpA disulfide reductase family protein [Minicystis sp.]